MEVEQNKEEVQNASGLYNLTRNLGGAIGLAFINSLMIAKSNIFAQNMKENMSITSLMVQENLGFLREIVADRVNDPELAAYTLLNNIINREALIIAINNIYIIVACMFCLSTLLLPFMSIVKNQKKSNQVCGREFIIIVNRK